MRSIGRPWIVFYFTLAVLSACQCGNTVGLASDGGEDGGRDGGGSQPAKDGGPDAGAPSTDGGCGLRTCASAGANCGPVGDGCGSYFECGSCTAPQTCGGGGQPSVCGGNSGCVPRTCASVGATCGPIGDGCGNPLECGPCDAGSCGGGGQPSVCGVSLAADGGVFEPDGGCLPTTCAAQGIGCGPAGDGCGNPLDCGGCDAGSCGGAGIHDQCGISTCTALTCALAGASCGAVGDGCGLLLQCGGCDAGICGGGGVPNNCGDSEAADAGPGCQGTLSISQSSATIQVANGTPTTLQLQAILSGCGTPQTVSASWVSSLPGLASVGTTTGLVTAQGPLGGTLVVSAGYGGQVAVSQITVVVAQTVFSGAPTSAPQSFGSAPVAGAPAFIYPLNQVVIPVNLQAPVFQWMPGASGSVYRVTLAGAYATLTGYVTPPSASQPAWQPAAQVWTSFAQSNIGRTVTVDLAESTGVGATVYGAPEQTLTLAASRFAGTIYYWAVNIGAILRLSAGSTTPQAFYTPPVDPSGGSQCIACHAVSPDGTKLSAELWGGGAPGTTLDLTQTPAIPYVSVGPGWDFSTFDPTGTLLVVSNNGDLTLRDSTTAAPVPTGSGEGNLTTLRCGAGATCTQPAWSRDGTLLTFIRGTSGSVSNDWTFSASDLEVAKWAATPQTFAAPAVLASNNFDGTTLANVYPSISVDDALIAFTRSPCSYGSGCPENATLEIISLDGGTPIELVQAESGDTSNRFPNFSPFKEGGYHWMAFFSMRNYGWVTSNERQVWLAAVDDNGSPVSDPSHPPFWLPGQDPTTENNKAEWATLPCVGTGQGCQGDIDCCSGLLCAAVDGGSVCLPASQACGFTGTSCQASSDCCAPLSCLVTGLCGTPCGTVATSCATTSDCCSGLGCDAGLCTAPSCNSESCAQQGFNCGMQGDGCGNPIDCGGCDAGLCGGGGKPGVCGAGCTPQTCSAQGIQCGEAGDGCGDTLDCGGCDAGSCGGAGLPGICGSGTHCSPESCAQQGISCGPAGDGCGNTLQCGTCDAGTCGGGGTRGVCGSPSCTPQTCAGLGYNCGAAGDGCGGLLQCGTCDAGTCGGNSKPNVCGSANFE